MGIDRFLAFSIISDSRFYIGAGVGRTVLNTIYRYLDSAALINEKFTS